MFHGERSRAFGLSPVLATEYSPAARVSLGIKARPGGSLLVVSSTSTSTSTRGKRGVSRETAGGVRVRWSTEY